MPANPAVVACPLTISMWFGKGTAPVNKLPVMLFTCLDFDLDAAVFTIWIYLHIIPAKTADLNAINKG